MNTKKLTQEEKAQEWYSQVSHSHILDSAVDALFNAITDNMKDAGVPEDVWDDVFDLMNDDFSVSNS